SSDNSTSRDCNGVMAHRCHRRLKSMLEHRNEKTKLDSSRDRVWRVPDDRRRGHALCSVMRGGTAKLHGGYIADLQRPMCELPSERRRWLRKKRARPHDL